MIARTAFSDRLYQTVYERMVELYKAWGKTDKVKEYERKMTAK